MKRKNIIIVAVITCVVAVVCIIGGILFGRNAKLNKAELLAQEGNFNEAFSIVSEFEGSKKADAVYNSIVSKLKAKTAKDIQDKNFSMALNNATSNKSYLADDVYKLMISDITAGVELECFNLTINDKDKVDSFLKEFKSLVFMTGITAEFTSKDSKSGNEISKSHFSVVKNFSNGTTEQLQNEDFEIMDASNYIAGTTQVIQIKEKKYGYTCSVKVICPEIKGFDFGDAKSLANKIKSNWPFVVSYIYDDQGRVEQASFSDARGRYLYFINFYYENKNSQKITSVHITNNMYYNKTENDYINGLFIKYTLPADSNERNTWVHANLVTNETYITGNVKYTLCEGVPSYSYFNVYQSDLSASIVQDAVVAAE